MQRLFLALTLVLHNRVVIDPQVLHLNCGTRTLGSWREGRVRVVKSGSTRLSKLDVNIAMAQKADIFSMQRPAAHGRHERGFQASLQIERAPALGCLRLRL